MKLKEKVAIITGAGRGIGRASAVAMAKEGASLVILSRTPKELHETARMIWGAGGEVLALKGDVSRSRDVKRIVGKAIERFGRIDVLMNNAGVIGAVKPLYLAEEKEWDQAIDVDLKGAFLFSAAAVSHMIKQRGGKIINVTSGLGEMVMPPFGLYSIAKAGLMHLTRIMAEELREYNIQVNGLDPGIVDTKMHEEIRAMGPRILGEEMYHEFLSLKEKGRFKSPETVARLAVFLASSESDGITGENGTESHYRRFGYEA